MSEKMVDILETERLAWNLVAAIPSFTEVKKCPISYTN